MKQLITLLSATLVSMATFAGEGHNHEAAVEPAPHGGVLRDADPYKVELVLNGDQAKIYVYDKSLKPAKLDKGSAKGHLRFPKEKKAKEITFTKKSDAAKKTDFYEATLTGISKVHRYDMHVDLEVGGKKVVGDFGVDNIH